MSDRIDIAPADAEDAAAGHCLAAYFAELDARFDGGFDPGPGPHTAGFVVPHGVFLLATRDGHPVGCVGLTGGSGAVAEVKRLWVEPSARGIGLATRLMAAVEAEARARGVTRLVLDTNRALTEARAFYRREGWTEIARYNDNPYADHWFAKVLPP